MKVGEAGEAFFVFETEHEVPEEFQTSPIMEAVPETKSDEVCIVFLTFFSCIIVTNSIILSTGSSLS